MLCIGSYRSYHHSETTTPVTHSLCSIFSQRNTRIVVDCAASGYDNGYSGCDSSSLQRAFNLNCFLNTNMCPQISLFLLDKDKIDCVGGVVLMTGK